MYLIADACACLFYGMEEPSVARWRWSASLVLPNRIGVSVQFRVPPKISLLLRIGCKMVRACAVHSRAEQSRYLVIAPVTSLASGFTQIEN